MSVAAVGANTVYPIVLQGRDIYLLEYIIALCTRADIQSFYTAQRLKTHLKLARGMPLCLISVHTASGTEAVRCAGGRQPTVNTAGYRVSFGKI